MQDTSQMQVTNEETQRAQSWRNSPVNRTIVKWNRGLDWNARLLQTNLSSTVLNAKFENSHVFLSWYARNLNINNLWCQMILKGSSCIPGILLRVQRRTPQKGKNSCCWDCLLLWLYTSKYNIFLIWYFELEVVSGSSALAGMWFSHPVSWLQH